MSEEPTNLDDRRGMIAQKETELRRKSAEVAADQAALKAQSDAIEDILASAPAASWQEVAGKARYLLQLFAKTSAAEDRRRQALIEIVLADFDRLAAAERPAGDN